LKHFDLAIRAVLATSNMTGNANFNLGSFLLPSLQPFRTGERQQCNVSSPTVLTGLTNSHIEWELRDRNESGFPSITNQFAINRSPLSCDMMRLANWLLTASATIERCRNSFEFRPRIVCDAGMSDVAFFPSMK
jgi:hypothetical protein